MKVRNIVIVLIFCIALTSCSYGELYQVDAVDSEQYLINDVLFGLTIF